MRKGICKLLRSLDYRSHHSVRQNIVIRWVRGLPKRRDECWFLMTDLSAGGAAQISHLYARRMSIEQLFRDQKNKWNGWSLRDTRITRPQRIDRLLLILAIAYLLLCGVGLIALRTGRPGDWSSSSTRNQCSVFTIGRIMLQRIDIVVSEALEAVIAASQEIVPKWG